mmetsp:Transcript_3835/g.9924  ORF Transcript_3835/g.9924 Transcript_3835/m.9924 type:complete len:110 (-) Transcript_3835:147-476(-)
MADSDRARFATIISIVSVTRFFSASCRALPSTASHPRTSVRNWTAMPRFWHHVTAFVATESRGPIRSCTHLRYAVAGGIDSSFAGGFRKRLYYEMTPVELVQVRDDVDG